MTSTTKPLPTQMAGLGGCTGRDTVATESEMELPSNCCTSSGGLGFTLMICTGRVYGLQKAWSIGLASRPADVQGHSIQLVCLHRGQQETSLPQRACITLHSVEQHRLLCFPAGDYG